MSWLNILRIKEHKNLNSSQPSQYILKCASKAFVMLNSKAGKKAKLLIDIFFMEKTV